ncbi:MAG: J domain-containing protein [Chlamydiota bacterium]|nr:J domain-containing protein [Chlamydiota bacterium]
MNFIAAIKNISLIANNITRTDCLIALFFSNIAYISQTYQSLGFKNRRPQCYQQYSFGSYEKKPKTHYKVLSIKESATPEEVNKSYKQLALIYHPDKNRGKSQEERNEACEKFKKIQEAREILSDPSKRAEYDNKNCQLKSCKKCNEPFDNGKKVFFDKFSEEPLYHESCLNDESDENCKECTNPFKNENIIYHPSYGSEIYHKTCSSKIPTRKKVKYWITTHSKLFMIDIVLVTSLFSQHGIYLATIHLVAISLALISQMIIAKTAAENDTDGARINYMLHNNLANRLLICSFLGMTVLSVIAKRPFYRSWKECLNPITTSHSLFSLRRYGWSYCISQCILQTMTSLVTIDSIWNDDSDKRCPVLLTISFLMLKEIIFSINRYDLLEILLRIILG